MHPAIAPLLTPSSDVVGHGYDSTELLEVAKQELREDEADTYSQGYVEPLPSTTAGAAPEGGTAIAVACGSRPARSSS